MLHSQTKYRQTKCALHTGREAGTWVVQEISLHCVLANAYIIVIVHVLSMVFTD